MYFNALQRNRLWDLFGSVLLFFLRFLVVVLPVFYAIQILVSVRFKAALKLSSKICSDLTQIHCSDVSGPG